jgi:preprotein translocase subunit YajC
MEDWFINVVVAAVVLNLIIVIWVNLDAYFIHRKLRKKLAEHQELFDTIVEYSNKVDFRLRRLEGK